MIWLENVLVPRLKNLFSKSTSKTKVVFINVLTFLPSIREQLRTPGMESKIRVVVAVTTLLLGPLDVGSSIVSKEGVLEMILVMANSGDFLQQKVSCEAIIAAASKKDKAVSILGQGVQILKKLYQIGNDNIKV